MQFKERLAGSASPAMPSAVVMTRLWCLAVLTCVVVVACERVPLTSPTGSTISVTTDQTTLPVNGQATVRAIVTESSGTPVHNGTQVNFTTVLGSFSPAEATTVGGVATTTFFAGSLSGTTRINAYSGGASTGSGNSSGGVEVRIGAAAAGSVSLQVTPPTVPQNGGTVTVTALVLDPSGNAMRGVPVQFSADTGTLSNANVVTNNDGYAVTNLVTTRTATVTARVGSAPPATFTVSVSTANTATIEATTTTPTVNSPVPFRLSPSTAANASPISSVVVDFGDGTSRTFNNITAPVGFTHTYTREGGYTVTATSTDINGGRGVSSTSIVVQRQQLPTVQLSAPTTANTTTLTPITFSAATTAAGAQIVSARVRLQDGTVIYSGTNANNFNYRFGGSGTYTLTGEATDSNGNTATTSTSVIVTP